MEEKIVHILLRLSQLERDMNSLKSKQLDRDPASLVITKDTSSAQVQ